MKTGSKGIKLIKEFEGFKSQAYLCPANVWTIGYGTTSGVKKGQMVTEEQAIKLLQDDLAKFEKAVKNLVRVPLNQDQFDALVAFVYNIGVGAFSRSTLLSLLNQGNYEAVPEQLLRWNKAGGRVLNGLTRRRQAEGKLFKSEV